MLVILLWQCDPYARRLLLQTLKDQLMKMVRKRINHIDMIARH
jgi:hypothetical protein